MVDHNGTDALWITDKSGQRLGATLMIPVHLTGSGATSENMNRIQDRALFLDKGGSDIQIVFSDNPIQGVLNQMDLSPGLDHEKFGDAREGVNMLGGNKGHIDSTGGQSDMKTTSDSVIGATLHDILHFAGVQDEYQEGPRDAQGNRTSTPKPGYNTSNIMTDRSGTQLKPEQTDEARKNGSTKQCTTDANQRTVCK